MNNINRTNFLILICFILLSGCSTVSPPTFEEQSATYSRTMEQYKINSIFTNIIRSSEDRPLAFVDIPSVLGNARTSSSIGGTLGFATAGDLWNGLGLTDLDSIEISPSQVYSEGFTFTQSSMDNSVFWSEMLIRIPIQKLVYFQGNSYPEEMLFNLLIDEFFILKENGDTERLANDFTKPSHEKFRKLFKFLIERIEIVADTKEDSLKSNYSNTTSKVKGTGDEGEDLIARICIAEKPMPDDEFKFHSESYCEKGQEKEFGKDKLVIILRSVKGIFEYLGQVVQAQSWDNPIYVDLKYPIDAFGQTRMKEKLTKNNSKRLFVVERDFDSEPKLSYAFTEDMYGGRFIIPSYDAGYSKKVISFLSELLILINVPGSAAPQPGILIR